jgi:hypothetical protein
VKYPILFEGINDIRQAAKSSEPAGVIAAQELILALSQMREHGTKVYAATIIPYADAGYSTLLGDPREPLLKFPTSIAIG